MEGKLNKDKLGENIKSEGKGKLGADFLHSESTQKLKEKKLEHPTESNDSNQSSKQNDSKMQDIESAVNELKEGLVRSLAEMENLKKRHQKELETSVKYANSSILKDLTEPFEQLFMALAVKPSEELLGNPAFVSLFNGIEMTKKAFEKAFEKHGLKRIYPKGNKFDHNIHQAISQIKQEGIDSGVIIDVVQAGYILDERIIKPALVIVAS